MPDIKPFFQRRARRPWTGLALAGPVGALATALLVAVGAGVLIAGSPLAHTQPAKLMAASLGTLLAALAGGVVIAPVLAWRLNAGRVTPTWALGIFLSPLAVALLLVAVGWPAVLRANAVYLLGVFALQALLSWGVFAYWSFPPYASKPKARRPKKRSEPEPAPVLGEPTDPPA